MNPTLAELAEKAKVEKHAEEKMASPAVRSENEAPFAPMTGMGVYYYDDEGKCHPAVITNYFDGNRANLVIFLDGPNDKRLMPGKNDEQCYNDPVIWKGSVSQRTNEKKYDVYDRI